jgi:hypothetical protein
MPKCVICRQPINTRRENHSHALIGTRKVYACAGCTEEFDAHLDARCPECGDLLAECSNCDSCGWKGEAEKRAVAP